MNENEGVKVLYIAGAARNGSTLLSRLLGEIEGFTNVGEAARYLFNSRQFSRGQPCGCGLQVSECEFWRDILPVVPEEVRQLATKSIRIRHLPAMLWPFKSRVSREELASIIDATGQVYRGIQLRENPRVIVDSSKNPANAWLLGQVPGIQLYTIHLVRDPRQVVGSWHSPKGYLRGFSPARATAWWWAFNVTSELLRKHSRSYLRIRYEDFVRNPRRTLERVAQLLDEEPIDLSFMTGNRAEIGTQHLLAGNPDRNSQGEITIAERDRPLGRSLRFLVTVSTLPLLGYYGYRLRRGGESS